MEKTYYAKSSGSMLRFCNSLLLIFVVVTSACAASSCSVLRNVSPPPSTAPIAELSIIPRPDRMVPTNKGDFVFNRDTKIIATNIAEDRAGKALNVLLNERYGFKPLAVTQDKNSPNAITFTRDQSQAEEGEAYTLKIEPSSIHIAGTERGMYYGCQSLLQLFPANFNGETRIPSADINDSPRFRYRGMHLDVARHFMRVEFVKKYIALIARYKYNYFHWHLTDDQGWRIEIDGYPNLTTIGSKRPETVLGMNFPRVYLPPNPYSIYVGDQTPVEGHYTREQIRDVVQYAKAHYVTIVPEIEMPGHASAALASYPELGCLENHQYKVQTTWGAFSDIFCPTERTFDFVKAVLSDIIRQFPDSPYIHIGGDEVLRTEQWTTSKTGKALMRANGLSNGKAIQTWFLNRIEQFVNSKERKIIGWDDMMDAGMPPGATVMAWRMEGDPHVTWDPAAVAVREKHDVIQAPSHFAYFDHLTGEGDRGRLSIYRELIPLDKVYSYEPVPAAGLSPDEIRHIIGGEGTLWTEFMEKPSDVEQMMFPRTLALAEVLWSKRENKNLDDFHKRLARELPILNQDTVNGRRSPAPATQSFTPDFPVAIRPVARQLRIPTHQVLNAPSLGDRTLPFRILLPADYETSNRRYAVLYLLHGLAGNENDWWDRTSLAQYAAKFHLIIVTPGAGDSWYANSAGDAAARYEDVIIHDLIRYIDENYRTIPAREGRAIAGNSMGGLGAMKFALRYPQLFTFAGSMSGTFDVPLTARLGKTPSAKLLQDLQRIFGDQNNSVRRENNVFLLMEQAMKDRKVLPYLYVSWGNNDPYPQVPESNRRFAVMLREMVSKSDYNERPGAHDWPFWDSDIELMLGRMCVVMKTICS